MSGLRHPNEEIFMKNKLTIMGRFGIALVAGISLGLGETAVAQTPRNYPPLKSGGSDYGKPTPTPGPKASPGAKGSKLSAKDKSFMMNAAKGGMMEVQWGKLSAQNWHNAELKKFGKGM